MELGYTEHNIVQTMVRNSTDPPDLGHRNLFFGGKMPENDRKTIGRGVDGYCYSS